MFNEETGYPGPENDHDNLKGDSEDALTKRLQTRVPSRRPPRQQVGGDRWFNQKTEITQRGPGFTNKPAIFYMH